MKLSQFLYKVALVQSFIRERYYSPRLILLTPLLISPFLLGLCIRAQEVNDLDAYWDPSSGLDSIDVSKSITALISDGNRLYAGGSFTSIGGIAANGIAVWDSHTWRSLGPGLAKNDIVFVRSILPIGDNLYVAGYFTQAGDINANYIARWDGSQWHSVGEGFDAEVLDLAWHNGYLYAGGTFRRSGNTELKRLARWNGETWESVGGGVSRPEILSPGHPGPDDTSNITSILFHQESLYVTGAFDFAGELLANSIAAWDGTRWTTLGRGLRDLQDGRSSFSGGDLVAQKGRLFVSGGFQYAGEVHANNLAMWDGLRWCSLGSEVTRPNRPISGLIADKESLYVAGAFRNIGDSRIDPVNGIAKWNGSSWSALGNGLAEGSPASIAIHQDQLWVGRSVLTTFAPPRPNNPAVFHLPRAISETLKDGIFNLSWPKPDEDIVLECSPDLEAASWTPVTTPPTLEDHRWILKVELKETQMFYRLRSYSEP